MSRAQPHMQHRPAALMSALLVPGRLLARLATLALTFLVLSTAALPAYAQDQGQVVLDVRAGFDGAYRIGEWFPITIDVANNGPDIRGVLEWSFPAQSSETEFQHIVDLPRGSRKRVTMYAFAQGFAQTGRLRLLDGSTQLAQADIRLSANDTQRFVAGVISSDPALLNSLGSLQLPDTEGASVVHIQPELLPDRVAALRSLNALFIHDIDTSALTPTQQEAITLWVRLGGQLIVSGGINGTAAAAGLAELLPVEVTDTLVQGDLRPLVSLVTTTDDPPGQVTLSEVRPHPTAEGLPPEAPLIYRWEVDAGAVLFSSFDLADLRGWRSEVSLWQQMLEPIQIFSPAANTRQQRVNVLETVLQLPSLGLPSTGTLLLLLTLYIVAIGPLNYIVLRRLGRLELAWVSLPLTIVVFAVAFYTLGFGLRSNQAQLNQAAVVQTFEGDKQGIGTAFVGLFSPWRTRYTLGFAQNVLVSEVRDWSDTFSQVMPVQSSETEVNVPDVLIDVASIRTFMAETTVEVPFQVESDLTNSNTTVTGEVRNTGNEPLVDALIVSGTSFQQLGTLPPGTIGRVTLDRTQNNFPWAVAASQEGFFNRQRMLSVVFDQGDLRFRGPGRADTSVLDEHGIYLLAWRAEPLVPVQIARSNAAQEGLTLYIIRLDV